MRMLISNIKIDIFEIELFYKKSKSKRLDFYDLY